MGRRDPKRLVYVPLGDIKYGFGTNIDEADSNTLGHVAVPGDYPDNFVLRANAPKPPRATRLRTTGTTTSFIDPARAGEIRTLGWNISGRRRIRAGGGNGLHSTPVYVNIGGIKYAWNMPNDTYQAIAGDRTGLGIQDAQPSDTDLVWGASFPKPPVVGKLVIGGGTDTTRYSTFADDTVLDNLPAGWSKIKDGYTTGP